ncbi:MAG: hypothetical protein ACK50A_14170 [Sphingobacteriaceae bacterium]
MNRKGLLNSVYFIVFITTLLFILDVSISKIIPLNTGIKNYWIIEKKNTRYNKAFIGPSRVLHSIDGEIFSEQGKRKVINLGLSGVSYAEQYLILRTFLSENKNTLDELYIEVSYFNFIDPDSSFSYPFHEYYYFPFIKEDYVSTIIQDNSKNSMKTLMWRYVPFIRYAEFNSEFRPLILFKNSYNESLNSSFDKYGTKYLYGIADTLKLQSCYYHLNRMNEKTLSYLERMILLARQEGAKVCLFSSPVFSKKVLYKGNAYINYKKCLTDIIAKHKVGYYDFENNASLSNIGYFEDYTHLNKNGAKAFSEVFAESISNEQ